MKYLYILILFTAGLLSCEKDNINIDKQALNESVDKKERDLITALHSSPGGWVMMLKSLNARDAYIPLVLRFDENTNFVTIKSPYGTQSMDKSTYLINRGTSGVILNFSGGSQISGLMRMGPNYSDLTDYQFNVLSATQDTITIQSIRSGGTYGAEGGVIYKLFRKPTSWTWADEDLKIDFRLDRDKPIAGRDARMNLKNNKTNEDLFFIVKFETNIYNINSWGPFDPMHRDASSRVFDLYMLYAFNVAQIATANGTGGTYIRYAAIQGHNSLGIFGFSGNTTTTTTNPTFNTKYGFNYLVFNNIQRTGNNIIMDVEAYDKEGKAYITGQYNYQFP